MPTGLHKLASSLSAGSIFSTASGAFYRVQSTNKSASGTVLIATHAGKRVVLDGARFAALKPLSEAAVKFASRFQMVAFNKDIDGYVKAAIRLAGYPVDETMDWSKYLWKVYSVGLRKVTTDEDRVDEAIHNIVIEFLYEKRILDADSPYDHFIPERANGETLERKVTGYLAQYFKFKVSLAAKYIQREDSGGMTDIETHKRKNTVGLEFSTDDGEEMVNHGEVGADGEGSRDYELDTTESREEVRNFCRKFLSYIQKNVKAEASRKLLTHITKLMQADNFDRQSVRESLSTNFVSKGKPLNDDGVKNALKLWGKLIKEFAQSSEIADTPMAQAIVTRAGQMAKGAKLAAPMNPNVLQQLNTQQAIQTPAQQAPAQNPGQEFQAPATPTSGNTAPAVQQPVPPTDPTQQPTAEQQNDQHIKKTIAPEIPGVNHTATEKTTMATNTRERIAALKLNPKFAQLRRVADENAGEVDAALSQFTESVRELAADLTTLTENLDLAKAAKQASAADKIAARKKYGSTLRKKANEEPEALVEIANQVYSTINTLAEDWENFSDHMGIELSSPEVVEEGYDYEDAGTPALDVPEAEVTEDTEDVAD